MRSLRSRLTFTHTLVALIAVLIVALLVSFLFRQSYERQRARFNQQQVQSSADSFAERVAEIYQQNSDWSQVSVRLRQQILRARPSSPLRVLHVQVLGGDSSIQFDSAYPSGVRKGALIKDGASAPVQIDGNTVGRILVESPQVNLSPTERAFLFGFYISVSIGSILAGLVALIVASAITRRLTRPLQSLQDAARNLSSGAQHEPLALPPDTELAALATTFNSMAAELDRQQQLRRQLVADIAHELRTPLSVLRMQIESMEDGIEEPTPTMLHSLGEEVGLLTRLVDDLRLLSLVDAGQLSLAITDIDANEAALRAVQAAAARARQQGIELEYAAGPEQIISADPQRLAQILGNLVENALRYTPAGGHVAVRVRDDPQPSAGRVIFEVSDTGPGIPPEELQHIFERFYRADKARARETGGTGLGLAIAQRLVEMQRGQIWASSTLGHGATFYVALPSAGASYTPTPLAGLNTKILA